jgi:hypothetical protein
VHAVRRLSYPGRSSAPEVLSIPTRNARSQGRPLPGSPSPAGHLTQIAGRSPQLRRRHGFLWQRRRPDLAIPGAHHDDPAIHRQEPSGHCGRPKVYRAVAHRQRLSMSRLAPSYEPAPSHGPAGRVSPAARDVPAEPALHTTTPRGNSVVAVVVRRSTPRVEGMIGTAPEPTRAMSGNRRTPTASRRAGIRQELTTFLAFCGRIGVDRRVEPSPRIRTVPTIPPGSPHRPGAGSGSGDQVLPIVGVHGRRGRCVTLAHNT